MDDFDILAVLDADGEFTLAELVDQLSKDKVFKARTRKATKSKQTREKLEELVDANLVKRRFGGGCNNYSLTNLGRKHLDEILG